jgi:hypothetical protein
MKFTLTYDGELRSNGKPKKKWEMRQQISPQLQELWRVDPVLNQVLRRRLIPRHGYMQIDTHHTLESYLAPHTSGGTDNMDLCEPIGRGAWKFIPLIRNSLSLRGGLRVTFLRKEAPGRVYQGGDMDNRLKTLFDALSVPNLDQVVGEPASDPTVYCLFEDDSLIAGLSVETGRLLTRPDSSEHEVRLIIEVDVRVVQARVYNQLFLGD